MQERVLAGPTFRGRLARRSIEAVVFDWGGTRSLYAEIELADMWQLAAERLSLEAGRAQLTP
jgi:hypothetical protein